jgi:hypothetical protein
MHFYNPISETLFLFSPILDKPDCSIHQSEEDGQIILTCEAVANPKEVVFGWSRSNESMKLNGFTTDGLISTLILDAHEDNFGAYYCYANNSMGAGLPFELDVQGIGLLKTMGNANIIIIVSVIAASIVALLIVIVGVILVCRRGRKPNEKCTYIILISTFWWLQENTPDGRIKCRASDWSILSCFSRS